jgi:L-serine dehydratase
LFNYPDFYNDVFGPIMQPFSSSHTAAPCRIGYLAHSLLGEKVKNIKVIIDPNGSFASSLKMMNVDLALISGATGHLPDNKILFEIEEYCKESSINYEILLQPLLDSAHHSAAKFILEGESGKTISLVGNSLGGGRVETVLINGFPFKSSGDTFVIFVFDQSGKQKLSDWSEFFSLKCTIIDEGIIHTKNQGNLLWFKTSDPIRLKDMDIETDNFEISIMKPIQPVLIKKERKPQLFDGFTKWASIAKSQGKSLYDVSIEYEMNSSCWSKEEVIDYMKDVVAKKMHRTTHAVLDEGLKPEETPFTGHHFNQWIEYSKGPNSFVDKSIAKALGYAFAAQAPVPGVEFVPGPMGAGGGLIYSALCAVKEEKGYSEEDLLRGLFIAAGVGAICFSKTEPGGVAIGCAGEQGVCAAMAAAAVCEMAGGTPEQVEAAASFAMQVSVGWPCDPVPGCKNQPCYSRAATTVAMSIVFAQLALSGRDAVFPLDEVINVADEVGRNLPEDQRGTSVGAHGSSPTAQKNIELFSKWSKGEEK